MNLSPVAQELVEQLNDDIISRGWILQSLRQGGYLTESSVNSLKDLLGELLSTKHVEIGTANYSAEDCVEFVAWRGSIESRVERAESTANSTPVSDQEFAYWLCLTKNVDRYES